MNFSLPNPGTFRTVLILTYLFLNVVSFALYALDKRRARRGKWRISERTLLFAAFFFGGVGALCGMLCFRHKTKKWKFRLAVPFFALLQIAGLFCLFARLSFL